MKCYICQNDFPDDVIKRHIDLLHPDSIAIVIKPGISNCSCGKSASEHESIGLLAYHHYWFFHKDSIPECSYCNPQAVVEQMLATDKAEWHKNLHTFMVDAGFMYCVLCNHRLAAKS